MATWMLVEDEDDLLEMLTTMGELMGISGETFVDGETALGWIDKVDSGRYEKKLPQFALVDIRLPNLVDGLEIGARLRRSPQMKDIPIILMTAYKLSADQEALAMRNSHADLLLYKPLPRYAELKSLFENITRGRQTPPVQA